MQISDKGEVKSTTNFLTWESFTIVLLNRPTAPFKYVGSASSCGSKVEDAEKICLNDSECGAIGHLRNGCWHKLKVINETEFAQLGPHQKNRAYAYEQTKVKTPYATFLTVHHAASETYAPPTTLDSNDGNDNESSSFHEKLKAGKVIGLWNKKYKRFIKMSGSKYIQRSGKRDKGDLPKNWGKEEFRLVDGGDGTFGLYNEKEDRYIRMPLRGWRIDRSDRVRWNVTSVPSGWGWERFEFESLGYDYFAIKCSKTEAVFVYNYGRHKSASRPRAR